MSNDFESYDDLRKQVEANGGLLQVWMEDLRELHEAGRLGKHVRAGIHEKLAEHGLGHLPAELPAYQEEEVRVYRLGTPLAQTINAVLHPSTAGDEQLRQSAGQGEDILRKIRELVCD
jgi:hypothetical protein